MQTNNCCKMCMCLNSALERLSSRYSHMLVFSIIYVHYFIPIHPHLIFINHFFSINNGVPSKCLVFFFHSDLVMLINPIKITSIVHFLPVNSQVFGGSFSFRYRTIYMIGFHNREIQ